jgi:hypothetical protein
MALAKARQGLRCGGSIRGNTPGPDGIIPGQPLRKILRKDRPDGLQRDRLP